MISVLISLAATALTLFVLNWIFLPAWNIHNPSCLILIIISLAVGITVLASNAKKKDYQTVKLSKYFTIGMSACVGLCVLVIIVGNVISHPIFNVKTYSSVVTVETKAFQDVLSNEDNISNIAIMDTDTAMIIGKRAMGSVADLVSQYEVSESYSTISYKNSPRKVAPLEYESILKYFANKETGIPGYISVDPVKNTAQYVALEKPIRYAPSAVLSEDLLRHIRSKYVTEMLYDMCFELDDEGNPYWICPIETSLVGLYGGTKITGIIKVDACDGSMEKLSLSEIPTWVDRVYDGDLLCEYYDSFGQYQNGFWNSIFGQKGCVMTTEDYGYKIIDDDVWIYTGVTSVASDESNIGFVLMNQRTMETTYFACSGAEEFSAMYAAQGSVQDLGYVAAFPSLININGIPTYIMCLKDSSGLVRMYALVNVEQYNMVGTGTTQTEALKNYKNILLQNDIHFTDTDSSSDTADITVARVDFLMIEGNTFCYISAENGDVYKQNFAENEELILIKEGDHIKISYIPGENDHIHQILAIEKSK